MIDVTAIKVFPGLWVAFSITDNGHADCVARGTSRVAAVTRSVRKANWLEHVGRAQFGSTNLLEDEI